MEQVEDQLRSVLGREPSISEIAGDIADRISALSRNRTNALFGGDDQLASDLTHQIVDLRRQADALGLDRGNYRGIFRDG